MFYALLALIVLGIWMFCLIDVLTTDERQVRGLPKFGWFLIVLLGFEIGAALWLVFGRPRRTVPFTALHAQGLPADSMARHPAWGDLAVRVEVPRGPDDDPDFLASLDRRIRGED